MFNKISSIKLTTLFFLFLFLFFSQSAMSAKLIEVEPNSPPPGFFFDSAFNIDDFFSSEFNTNIGDIAGNNISTNSSHVSIIGSGDGTYDYYSFTINNAGTIGVFDIDFGASPDNQITDTEIALWDSKGTVLSFSDDSNITAGADGSTSTLDPFIQYTFLAAGKYVVGVAKFNAFASTNGWIGSTLESLDTYTLNVALGTGFAQKPVPLPPAIILFLSGILSIFGLNLVKHPKK